MKTPFLVRGQELRSAFAEIRSRGDLRSGAVPQPPNDRNCGGPSVAGQPHTSPGQRGFYTQKD
jgi:hypothetical protein